MAKLPNPVQMAVVGAAHGIRGEVRVRSFTGDPAALGDYGPLFLTDGRALTVAAIRPGRDDVIVRFEEIAERTAAEALAGEALYVDRSALPDILEEDEFYHADLIGLTVLDGAGETVGTIAALHDFGAGDVIEIVLATDRTAMAPFTRAAVPEIDPARGIVRIDRRAAGLDDETETRANEPEGATRQGRPRGRKSAGDVR